jgi:hypothetical protein
MRLTKLWAGVVLVLAGMSATSMLHAQGTSFQVLGPVQKIQGIYVTALNPDGRLVTFEPSGRIVSNQPITVNDIRAGQSVAFDTYGQGDELVVTHVHTQDWLRDPGTFATRPLRSDPDGTRHLGVIDSVEPIENGIRMTVTHEGGESSVTVDVLNTTSILYHNRVEEFSAIQIGAEIMANVAIGDDGVYRSGFVTVEVDGVRPVQVPG